jgi:hypothetical protein
MNLNEDADETPQGTLSAVIVDLPQGLLGNPIAVPRCKRADFEGTLPHCPANTQIGFGHVPLAQLGTAEVPIYNLVPPLGVPASIGLSIDNVNSFQDASLRSGSDYGVSVSDITVPTALLIQGVEETIWGVPADEGHRPNRICPGEPYPGIGGPTCPAEAQPAPFLSLPTSCAGPLVTTVHVESLENPGVLVSESAPSLGPGGVPAGLSGCRKLPFAPTLTARPETTAADSPTGLDVGLHIPQSKGPEGLATANLKDTVVTLPAGMVVNPSSADGLGACPLAGPQGINLPGSPEPTAREAAKCPPSSKLGTVEVKTPVLDHPVTGSVYLARQGENPFNSLLALYIAVEDPLTGVVVKLAGKVEPDPQSGQLRATFPNNPQLPFDDLNVLFSGGPRASLTTPPTCGSYRTTAVLTPWSAPEGASAFPGDSFQIATGAAGGPCAGSEGQLPHRPNFEAGTTSQLAGSYSPFVFKLARENGSQRIAAIDTTLPKGLTGKLAGIPYCSEAQIAAASARSGLGQGAAERAAPSCPLASEVGLVNVGAGSGTPFYVQGHAYLAGPYKGAPLSLVIITPAVAGPFDLGAVVVRTALYVDQSSAQIHAVSDPLPAIIAGIPLDVRTIALNMNRPDFTLNPTNCDPMAVLGAATSTLGQIASLQSRFQVAACGALGFKPQLALSLKGGTRRTNHPKLKAVLTYPKGAYANIAKAAVTLPRTEFIDPDRVANPCTRPQFAEGKCPKDSILGTAKAFTPLLDQPLTGKVYFLANGGERELPDVVADLNGQVHFVLVGFVDAVVKKGTDISRIRNTFANVPDAPVSKFILELKGGKEGLLQNSANLCAKALRATVKLTAQNARTHNFNPVITTSCKKK